VRHQPTVASFPQSNNRGRPHAARPEKCVALSISTPDTTSGPAPGSTPETAPKAESSLLRITVVEHPERLEVQLDGEMDLSTSGQLTATVRTHLQEAPSVRLDLSRLAFCDVVGLSELVAVRQHLVDVRRELVVSGHSRQVLRLIRVVELDELLGTAG
jgi:anti-anti-sigma factor